jgi:hypothetical protein
VDVADLNLGINRRGMVLLFRASLQQAAGKLIFGEKIMQRT